MSLIVEHLPLTLVHPMRTVRMNASLIYDEMSHEAMIVDPCAEIERICSILTEKSLKLKYIFLTHGHFDHILGALALQKCSDADMCTSHGFKSFLSERKNSAIYMLGEAVEIPKICPDILLREGSVLTLGSNTVRVSETPGHTPDSISCYIPGHIFSGDVVLKGGTGRMDLPGSDMDIIVRTIRNRILSLPPETIIHCGHGELSSVEYERTNNVAVNYR